MHTTLTLHLCVLALLSAALQSSNNFILAHAALKKAYPAHIEDITSTQVMWHDGTSMPLGALHNAPAAHERLDNPSLQDQLGQARYIAGPLSTPPRGDPGRIRHEPFFRKMYGNSPQEVERNLELIPWMPNVFGNKTIFLPVTRINNIHEKIRAISQELEALVTRVPAYIPFLENPAGTYCWRWIAGTNRLSNHSFGMTIDINAKHSQYWQWDLAAHAQPILETMPLVYRNTIPWDIVAIFEKYGFIWGGKWYHYDTMHFEYRPELFDDLVA